MIRPQGFFDTLPMVEEVKKKKPAEYMTKVQVGHCQFCAHKETCTVMSCKMRQ